MSNTSFASDEVKMLQDRLHALIVGTPQSLSSAPALKSQHQSIMSKIEKTLKDIKKLDFTDNSKILDVSRTGSYQAEARYLLNEVLPTLSIAYKYPGLPGAKNPYYNNKQTLDKTLLLFDHLNVRGWKKGVDTGFDYKSFEATGFAGFGGSINNNIGGYSKSVFLLRNELRDTNRLQRELDTLNSVTRMFSPPAKGTKSNIFAYDGINSDMLKSLTNNRLPYILTMKEGKDQTRNLEYLQALLNKGYTIAPGWADTFKADGVGYHHKSIYGGAYTTSAIEAASRMIYLLNGSSYAPTNQSIDNIKNCMKSVRFYCQKYDMPRPICGRFPTSLETAQKLVGSAAYLGTSRGYNDPEARAIFARLWDENHLREHSTLFSNFGSGKGLGEIGTTILMLELAAEKPTAEADPQGYKYMQYGALTSHRRDDWLVSIKGISQYIWDYEAKLGKKGSTNIFGRYEGNGTMTLYTHGSPVNRNDSGYSDNGWNWNRLPGATSVNIPLFLNKQNQRTRRFTDQTYVGGVNLDNMNGVSVMRLRNLAGNIDVFANKSWFFFDNQVVALGSDITLEGKPKKASEVGDTKKDNDKGFGSMHVETTLFQSALLSQKTVSIIDGKAVTGLNTTFTGKADSKVILSDAVGNVFYALNAHNLKVTRAKQNSYDHTGKRKNSGAFVTAYFDHGITPKNQSYAYTITMKAGKDNAAAATADIDQNIQIIQQSSGAHIVKHNALNQTGYAIFNPQKADLKKTFIKRASTPCIVMTENEDATDGYVKISVSNPDFGWIKKPRLMELKHVRDAAMLYSKSQTMPVKITLQGKWEVTDNKNVKVTSQSSNSTTLLFACIDASTTQATLKKLD
ncbi:hypothetical protein JD969_19155 [Planctomycetota bacterium]|nr:hypothetical protein JD969_19155 [Planctomycetota bacterium]